MVVLAALMGSSGVLGPPEFVKDSSRTVRSRCPIRKLSNANPSSTALKLESTGLEKATLKRIRERCAGVKGARVLSNDMTARRHPVESVDPDHPVWLSDWLPGLLKIPVALYQFTPLPTEPIVFQSDSLFVDPVTLTCKTAPSIRLRVNDRMSNATTGRSISERSMHGL